MIIRFVSATELDDCFIRCKPSSCTANPSSRQFLHDYPAAVLRFCLIVAALFYNYTEASFAGINNMWLLFLAAAIDASGARAEEFASPSVRLPLRRGTALRTERGAGRLGPDRRRAFANRARSAV